MLLVCSCMSVLQMEGREESFGASFRSVEHARALRDGLKNPTDLAEGRRSY